MPAQGKPGHHDTVGSSAPLREPLRKLGEAERPDLNRKFPEGSRDMKIGLVGLSALNSIFALNGHAPPFGAWHHET
jgi:hypothetical protein